MLSAVLIAKNEEAVIRGCILSLAGVDEIVVCDTGSRDDRTIAAADAAAKEIGVPLRLARFEWCDDFARARNAACAVATGDWILSIDADESLRAGSLALLRDAIGSAKGRTVSVQLVAAGSGDTHRVVRCFRREVKWIGEIHEVPEHNDGDACNAQIVYGSSPARALDPDRNLRILSRVVALQPEHARSLYYLAREYWYRQQWDHAESLFRRCVRVSRFASEKADAHLYLARILSKLGRAEEARLDCLNAIALLPGFREALRFMGELSGEEAWSRVADVADNAGVLFVRGR